MRAIVAGFTILTAFSAYGQSQGVECGKASVVEGNTCSNVKVEMDFSGCPKAWPKETISKVQCVGHTITARRVKDGYRFEAKFDKKTAKDGAVTWEAKQPLTYVVKTPAASEAPKPVEPPAPVAAPAAPPAAPPAPSVPATPAEPPAPAAAPVLPNLKISAFFDARYTSLHTERDSRVVNSENGFMLEDGALYIGYTQDFLSLNLDLPFSRLTELVDTNGDGTGDTPSSDNADFGFAKNKAQAYAKFSIWEQSTLTFGQWDTVYGVEANDSKDRVFGKTGLVYDLALPVTHTGIIFETVLVDGRLRLLAANPNNKGSLGHDSTGQNEAKTEYGATIGFNNDKLRVQAGYLARRKNNIAGLADTRDLVDITAGATLGRFTLDLEYAMVRDPAKNALTGANDEEDAGKGLLALVTYKVNPEWLVGLRYEKVEDYLGAAGNVGAIADASLRPDFTNESYGLSFHYKVHPSAELRAEYITYSAAADGQAKEDQTERFAIGGVFTL